MFRSDHKMPVIIIIIIIIIINTIIIIIKCLSPCLAGCQALAVVQRGRGLGVDWQLSPGQAPSHATTGSVTS